MIISPANAKYVGSSVDIKRRIKQYKYLRHNEQHKLRHSIKKYGYKNHRFVIIETCEKDVLLERERYWCIKHNALHRYNLNLKIPLKDELMKSFSQEVLEAMSKAHKNKVLSEDQKNKLIASTKGKKQSPEHIEKRKMFGNKNPAYGNAYFKGRTHSEESKALLSKARKGKFLLGKNPNAKKVINIVTKQIYDSAKEVSITIGMNYSTLRAMLQNNNKNKNKTNFIYYEEVITNTI